MAAAKKKDVPVASEDKPPIAVNKPVLVACDEIDNWRNLPLNALCEIFPEASDDDYDALVISLKERGFMLDQPIIMVKNDVDDFLEVLDGRNRLTASMDAGVVPVFMEYVGEEPMGFVMARNLSRRHLTPGQKAALASKLVTSKLGDNQETEGAVTRDEAAKLVQSNTTSIAKFKRIQDADPGLAKEVEMGHVTLDKAYNKVSKPVAAGGQGKGQKPGEAKTPEKEDDDERVLADAGITIGEDGSVAPLAEVLAPPGSLDMSFEQKKPGGKKLTVTIDRGPWDSGNPVEDTWRKDHCIHMIGTGPQTVMLTYKEAMDLANKLGMAISKMQ